MSEKEIRDTGAIKILIKNYCVVIDDNNEYKIDLEETPIPSGKKHVMWIPKTRKLKMYNDDSFTSINAKIKNKVDPDFEIDNGNVIKGNDHVENI